ncbi:MAG: PAS domain S-box protein [Herpetosiphon sp.]|nr:PAS domain S-box protein [Herpetosiphon sp.]
MLSKLTNANKIAHLQATVQRLVQAEAQFRNLLESAPDAIVIVDHNGTIVMLNAQAERIFGYDRQELLNQPIEQLIPERFAGRHKHHRDSYVADPHTRPMGTGMDLMARRKDGSEFPAEISLSYMENDEDLWVTAVVRDVTTQRAAVKEQEYRLKQRVTAAEAGLLQSARLAAVGQLAASIAHEINNPLYAARNSLYLLEEDLPEEYRASPYIALARDQLARIAGIIERMRDFYRPLRGDLEPNDLNRIIEDTLALAGLHARHSNTAIMFKPDHELPSVICNADLLRQVFLNLVVNAFDAMNEGGTLTVRTFAKPDVAIAEISDTGIGIPDDIRAHIFEPFFTNKPNGTGLGLPISAHIVTQHGGQIDVESVPHHGTTFRISLPYEP